MICSLTLVRNEDWILALSARALMMWVDHAVFLDHCSTDSSPQILSALQEEYPGRVTILTESDPVWEEMRHRQRTLDKARELGAKHVCIIDADEILTGDLLPSVGRVEPGPMGSRVWGIREMIYDCPANATMQLPWLCLRDSHLQVHRSGVWGEQSASMAFVDNPELHWSSAGRASYDFHHRPPMGRPYSAYNPVRGRASGLMHLQFVNARRLRAKQALYQATEVLRWPGRETPDQIRRKYSLSVYGAADGQIKPFDLAVCPGAWWEPYQSLMKHYDPDAAPWQEYELKRLIEIHGREFFAGLDFFGVV